jgi:hypothetical protein
VQRDNPLGAGRLERTRLWHNLHAPNSVRLSNVLDPELTNLRQSRAGVGS